MYKTVGQGVALNLRIINPSELSKMDENDIIIVNRVRLNSKLVECEIRRTNHSDTIAIRKAIKTMKMRERKSRRAIMGAEMSVRDVIKAFPDYESLPKNSFAYAIR